MPMVSMEATILIPIALVGISLHFLWLLQGWIILDLHKNLLKQHIQRSVLLIPCWRARLLIISLFLILRPSLLWTRALLRMTTGVSFYSFRSLPLLSYNDIFCIHEILSRMDKLSHGLRLFFIEFVKNKSELTSLWKAANRSLSSTSFTLKASLLKRVMNDRRLSFSPYSMVNKLDEERLCLCPPMKLLTNNLLKSSKELTEFGGILLN